MSARGRVWMFANPHQRYSSYSIDHLFDRGDLIAHLQPASATKLAHAALMDMGEHDWSITEIEILTNAGFVRVPDAEHFLPALRIADPGERWPYWSWSYRDGGIHVELEERTIGEQIHLIEQAMLLGIRAEFGRGYRVRCRRCIKQRLAAACSPIDDVIRGFNCLRWPQPKED